MKFPPYRRRLLSPRRSKALPPQGPPPRIESCWFLPALRPLPAPVCRASGRLLLRERLPEFHFRQVYLVRIRLFPGSRFLPERRLPVPGCPPQAHFLLPVPGSARHLRRNRRPEIRYPLIEHYPLTEHCPLTEHSPREPLFLPVSGSANRPDWNRYPGNLRPLSPEGPHLRIRPLLPHRVNRLPAIRFLPPVRRRPGGFRQASARVRRDPYDSSYSPVPPPGTTCPRTAT